MSKNTTKNTPAVRPLHDQVLIRKKAEREEKVGLIYKPESTEERPQEGEILTLGKEVDQALGLKPGDKVIFGKYAGTEIKVKDDVLFLLKADEILGILQ